MIIKKQLNHVYLINAVKYIRLAITITKYKCIVPREMDSDT